MLGKINSKKHLFIITLILASFSQIGISYALDVKAAEALKEIEGLFKQPIQQRKLSSTQTELFIKRAETGNGDMKICAIIALTFAEDSNSLEILKKHASDKYDAINGVASYALKVRQVSGRKPDEILRNLCFFLGNSDNQFEKMFLANRMWVDFKEEAIYTFLDSIQSEPNDIHNFYRCDLFYYLSKSDNPEILKEALKLDWKESVMITLPDDLAYIMDSITPGRREDQTGNAIPLIIKNIQKKLGQN
ncbi:MAG: hypothetical protein JW787_14030 [Sedimentisphaerales bacterium]|nr:hypothetical protein [Sedimentisphaerales bacterium]